MEEPRSVLLLLGFLYLIPWWFSFTACSHMPHQDVVQDQHLDLGRSGVAGLGPQQDWDGVEPGSAGLGPQQDWDGVEPGAAGLGPQQDWDGVELRRLLWDHCSTKVPSHL